MRGGEPRIVRENEFSPSDQPELADPADRLAAAGRQLAQDAPDVGLDGVDGDLMSAETDSAAIDKEGLSPPDCEAVEPPATRPTLPRPCRGTQLLDHVAGYEQFVADLPVHPLGVMSVRRRGQIVMA